MTSEQAAAQVLAVLPSTLSATRIKSGLTNQSFCVTDGSQTVVVRLSTTDEHALQLNRVSEAVVLQLVERAAIGATVLWCAPEARILVTRKLPGRMLELIELREPQHMLRVATLLRRLHDLPVPPTVQSTDLTTVLQGYWRESDLRSASNDEVQLKERMLALRIAEESARQSRRCLCHNDVHHLNLLDDGERLWLLDWEYAGVGDPYFDLASVCCYHGYNEPQRNQLLALYSPTHEQADRLRLAQMCWLFDYIKELWFVVRTYS